MPILTESVKLLKSAVMANVPEGGGAMTGIEVIDGQSNNLYSDTSAVRRAFGGWEALKVFGVAHTDDTDLMLGAHAIITKAPADPLVQCTLMRTSGWADTRSTAQEVVERYLVKGPRINLNVFDNHYAGSLLLRLFGLSASEFPAGGDAIVIRSVDGTKEQYVRVLRVAASVIVMGNKSWQVATCELGQALQFDFEGPSMTEEPPVAKAWTSVYTTTTAGGAKFHGIKPLGAAGSVGDLLVQTEGGIYTPLVPASTVESPIIDQYPLLQRQSLNRTAARSTTLPAVVLALTPGTVLALPTAAEPGSISISHGATLFLDDAAGVLKQGSTAVGTVDYKLGTVTLASGAPSYGSASNAITYKPATVAGASTHSDAQTITIANQGLAWTYAFEPPPAPGSFTLSYPAQGRWYTLEDNGNGNGKLAGADTSYGVGSLNYTTGSLGVTLGAVPDIGGAVIYQWSNAAAAKAYGGAVPARLSCLLDLPYGTAPASLVLGWLHGGVAKAATCSAAGVLSGDATGTLATGWSASGTTYGTTVDFAPALLPDGDVTTSWTTPPAAHGEALDVFAGDTLAHPPAPRSVSLQLLAIPELGFELPYAVQVVDNGAGALICTSYGANDAAVGSVNYATGEVQVVGTVQMDVYENVAASFNASTGNVLTYARRVLRPGHTVAFRPVGDTTVNYTETGAGPTQTETRTPGAWSFSLPVATGLALRTDGLVFEWGGQTYHSAGGVLRKGWNALTGEAAVASAGSVTSAGRIEVTSLPAGGGNALTLVNAAVDAAGGLGVGQGVFRVGSAPLKTGVLQLQAGSDVGNGNGAGVISGGGFAGTVDYQRGIVRWNRTATLVSHTWGDWLETAPIAADQLSYNAVYLAYLPLDAALLGINTARLPLDGKVPIYRPGDLLVVHNTLTTQLPNPLVKGTAYSLGRERIASVRVKDALGVLVPSSLYVASLDPGTLTVPAGSDITGYSHPFTVENRIEDMVVCTLADISGQLKLQSRLTHSFPAGTSFVSSALVFGDLFARVHGYIEQATWSGAWSDELVGAAPLAQFNAAEYPILTTNRGALTERWALIFTSNTAFRIIGESVGQVGTGDVNTATAPNNPASGVPYFSIPPYGWGGGWSAGNVLRFNTAACGAPFWPIRTVLQGPASVESDVFEIAFRTDVDRP